MCLSPLVVETAGVPFAIGSMTGVVVVVLLRPHMVVRRVASRASSCVSHVKLNTSPVHADCYNSTKFQNKSSGAGNVWSQTTRRFRCYLPPPRKPSIPLCPVQILTRMKGHWSAVPMRCVIKSTPPVSISPRLTSLLIRSFPLHVIVPERTHVSSSGTHITGKPSGRTRSERRRRRTSNDCLGDGNVGLEARLPVAFEGVPRLGGVGSEGISRLSGERR